MVKLYTGAHSFKIRMHAFKIKHCIIFGFCVYNKIWYTFISQKYGSVVSNII